MAKKKILFHSNYSKAFTGFGKNTKNVLKHLYSTGKYEIVEFSNGFHWSDSKFQNMPWKTIGSLPDDQEFLQKINSDPSKKRAAGYGAEMIDKVIQQEKPDIYIGSEDIWAFNGYYSKKWWNKINCMIWTTLDSLPILPDAVNAAPQIKNYYVWSSFAEKALHELGHNHVKTLHGSVDCSSFFRFSDDERIKLRNRHKIDTDCFIIGFVFRNQLRKSAPNLLDGFKMFLKENPQSKAKLLLHTNWSEGWDLSRLIKEKNIDPSLVLTTYFCSTCKSYFVKSFTGQNQKCSSCGSQTLNTTNIAFGVSESQLNEVYNLMDVYCHPFTSGGQEIPIQEAKLTELITLVTNYSCGEDSCNPESGGIPLDWAEYREPGTQFIKATTYPSSISKNIKKVYNMKLSKKRAQGKKSREYVIKEYSSESIGKKLENIIDEMPDHKWNFNISFEQRNPSYSPPDIKDNQEWIIDLYKNILLRETDPNDNGVKHWIHRLNTDMNREGVLNYFKSIAVKENTEENKKSIDFFVDQSSNKKALMVSSGDENLIFAATSLFESFHQIYKNTDLYFACHPAFFNIVNGNPHIKKLLEYDKSMENELLMIKPNNENKYFNYYINLNFGILKNISSINSYAFH